MTLIAYDAADPVNIPAAAAAVLPYSDGLYKWSNLRYPHALFRYFTVTGLAAADIADYEPGNPELYEEGRLRNWADRRLAAGHPDLTVYSDRDDVPAVKREMAGLTWHLFLATLDGTKPVEYDGIPLRAVQYTDRQTFGFDLSLIYDVAWLNKPG